MVLDALPAEPDAIAAVSGQIAALAIERASNQHQKETESLQAALSERDVQASELQTRCDELLSDHVTLTEDLASAHDSIARLEGEKAALAASVRTLAERIQKLEAFKRTLIASLQDDTPGAVAAGMSSGGGGSSLWGEAPKAAPPPEGERLVQEILANAKPAPLPHRPQLLHGDSASKQHRMPYKNGTSHNGYTGASANGLRSSSASGRERGVSPATSHAALTNPHPLNSAHIMHDKPPASQLPAAQLHNTHKSDNGPHHHVTNENSMASVNAAADHSGSLPAFGGGDTPVPGEGDGHPQRVDGKEFFRQARTRLPYEAFAAFLQNIKDLNTGKQSREQTLERACSIFGDSNTDLFLSFKALLARHLS